MKIKDEWVEAVARVLIHERKGSRGIIEAVAPLIRADAWKEAAEVCEQIAHDRCHEANHGHMRQTDRWVQEKLDMESGAKACAQAIRKLKEGE